MKLLIIAALINFAMPYADKPGDSLVNYQGQEPLFSFGIITDVHHCDCEPSGTRFYDKALPRLREAMNSMKTTSADFVVNLGDIIDKDYRSFQPVLDIIDSSGVKVWNCLGNHDFSVKNRFKKRLPLPLPAKEGYYSFSHKNLRFIILNGNDLSTYSSANRFRITKAEQYIGKLQDEGSINAIDWNGGLDNKQLRWLDEELTSAETENEKVFIFCHFPIWPENLHNLLNYKEVVAMLENHHNVIAWFSGHNHAGNYGNFNMIHCVTLKAMVETEDMSAWSVVEVYSNKIWIKGSGREKSLILAY